MVDLLDLYSLKDTGIELYNCKKYTQAKSYLIQARNLATQLEEIKQIKIDLTGFKSKCNEYIGLCIKNIDSKELEDLI